MMTIKRQVHKLPYGLPDLLIAAGFGGNHHGKYDFLDTFAECRLVPGICRGCGNVDQVAPNAAGLHCIQCGRPQVHSGFTLAWRD